MKFLRVTMPDGSQWDVPALMVVLNYEKAYAGQRVDDEVLIDHAANNMNWSDVRKEAVMVRPPEDTDYQDGWVNGKKRFVTR